MKREFTGVFIPAHIWISKLLPAEKMLLGEVSALSVQTGWCTASREHFAEWLHCDITNVTHYVKKLERLGYLEVNRTPGFRSKMRVKTDAFYIGEVVNPVHGGSEPRSRGVVNPIHGGSEPHSPEIKDKYNSKIKDEIQLAPQAAFITTHTPAKIENIEVVIVEGETFDLEEKTLEPITPAAGKKPRAPKTAGNSTAAVCAEIKTPEVLDFFHSIHAAWAEWIDYKRRERKGTYKSAKSEAATITELANEVNCDPEAARAAIQRSIAKTYTGICPDKNWKSSTPPPRYSLEDKPQANTPEQMKEELSRFYNANIALLSEAQKTAGTNYTGDRLRSIVIDFCSNLVRNKREGETFGQHHAALGSWLKRQKEFDAAKSPATTQHTAGPQPQAPLRSAAPVNYSIK